MAKFHSFRVGMTLCCFGECEVFTIPWRIVGPQLNMKELMIKLVENMIIRSR